MKNESCQTCKHRTGTRCDKNVIYIGLQDWCYNYKKKEVHA